jgi:hypothetical protein
MDKFDQVSMTLVDCLEFNLFMENLDILRGLVDRKKLEILSGYAETQDDGNFVMGDDNRVKFKDTETKDRFELALNKFMGEYSDMEIKNKFRVSGKVLMTPAEIRFIKELIEII